MRDREPGLGLVESPGTEKFVFLFFSHMFSTRLLAVVYVICTHFYPPMIPTHGAYRQCPMINDEKAL